MPLRRDDHERSTYGLRHRRVSQTLRDPLSGFLNLSAAYAIRDFTALFRAVYAHGIRLSLKTYLRRSAVLSHRDTPLLFSKLLRPSRYSVVSPQNFYTTP